jgi:hypothetical protein
VVVCRPSRLESVPFGNVDDCIEVKWGFDSTSPSTDTYGLSFNRKSGIIVFPPRMLMEQHLTNNDKTIIQFFVVDSQKSMLEVCLYKMNNGEWQEGPKKAFLQQGQLFEVPPRNGYQLINRSETHEVKLLIMKIEEVEVNENA